MVADSILRTKGYHNLRIYRGSWKDWVENDGDREEGNFDEDYDVLTKDDLDSDSNDDGGFN
jgi:hypothetical protein